MLAGNPRTASGGGASGDLLRSIVEFFAGKYYLNPSRC